MRYPTLVRANNAGAAIKNCLPPKILRVLGCLFFIFVGWSLADSSGIFSFGYAKAATRLVAINGIDSGNCKLKPCRTIQFAIDTAADGDLIKISPGIYPEKLTLNVRSNLTIQGDNLITTIIQGDHTVSQIRIQSSVGITIQNLTIRDGGDSRHNEGGGVQVFGTNPRSNVVLENLVFSNNAAVNGGALAVEDGEVKITNCLIFGNVASNGGGAMIVRRNSTVTLTTTTVTENFATFLAGGVVNEAQLTVSNSIFWNNNLEQINTFAGGGLGAVTNVSFSDIQEGYAGLGNIDQDPIFVDAPNGIFRLSAGSPAIDAGINAEAPEIDLYGKPRPLDGNGDGTAVVDMGAIEFVTTNDPPNCSTAVADPAIVWPANHKMVPIRILVLDPPQGILNTVTGFTQDEPVSGLWGGDQAPDAWVGPIDPMVRAERSGRGNGRVYAINFTARDVIGGTGTCQGVIYVCVPRNNQPGSVCINDGQIYDSTLEP